MNLLARDHSGVPSWTMTLSLAPMVLITAAFVLARFKIGSDIGVAEYAGAMTLLSGPILARKWVNSNAEAKKEAAQVTARATVKAAETLADAKLAADAVIAEAAKEERSA